jgi:3-oxoacyl-[acyl-carrier protein] reductase
MQRDLSVQFKSAFAIAQAILPAMVKRRMGRIVFVLSSVTLNVPPKFLAHYVSSKYATLGLMKAMAAEYVDKNITVNAVSPSLMDTPLLSEIPRQIIELNAENHPLKRNATVADAVPLIQLLLTEKAGFMTGLNIPVAGGTTF